MTINEPMQPEELITKDEKVSPSKTMNVLLTSRDVDILRGLHEHVVLSFRQIHERFFTHRTFGTSMNRLKKIEALKLIERLKIPRVHVLGRKNVTGVVFQLTLKGRELLLRQLPDVDIFEKCPRLNIYQVDHDLLIADISSYFKRQYPNSTWINGRYLKITSGVRKIPDAILKPPDSTSVVAIELELTVKSSRRYREIIALLRSSRDLKKVIFVTANTSIGKKIMSAIEGYAVPEGHRLRSDFFEFVRLEECLKNQTLGPIKDPS